VKTDAKLRARDRTWRGMRNSFFGLFSVIAISVTLGRGHIWSVNAAWRIAKKY